MERLDLKIRHYEILSIGPSSGLVEFIKDVTTIDNIKRVLHDNFKEIKTLNQFFRLYYKNRLREA